MEESKTFNQWPTESNSDTWSATGGSVYSGGGGSGVL